MASISELGDQLLLNEKEADGYWDAGIFLTTRDRQDPLVTNPEGGLLGQRVKPTRKQ